MIGDLIVGVIAALALGVCLEAMEAGARHSRWEPGYLKPLLSMLALTAFVAAVGCALVVAAGR